MYLVKRARIPGKGHILREAVSEVRPGGGKRAVGEFAGSLHAKRGGDDAMQIRNESAAQVDVIHPRTADHHPPGVRERTFELPRRPPAGQTRVEPGLQPSQSAGQLPCHATRVIPDAHGRQSLSRPITLSVNGAGDYGDVRAVEGGG
jgi:hypothetical protein